MLLVLGGACGRWALPGRPGARRAWEPATDSGRVGSAAPPTLNYLWADYPDCGRDELKKPSPSSLLSLPPPSFGIYRLAPTRCCILPRSWMPGLSPVLPPHPQKKYSIHI